MHVGFITPEYPNEKLSKCGGLGTSLKNLAMSLVTENIEVTIFVVNQMVNDEFEDEGVNIITLNNKNYKLGNWYFNRKHINRRINSIVEKSSIDILEAPDWTGITAFMKFKCPLVLRLHGSDAYFCYLDKRKQKFKNYIIEKTAVRGADAFVSPTAFAAKHTKELFEIKNSNIEVIHNGLFLDRFNNVTPEVYDSGKILYLGTLVRKKGVFELVKIFNEIAEKNNDARLVLIGSDSGDQKTNSSSTWELMKAEFSEDALKRVDYKGKVPYKDVNQYIMSANVCVFPSFAETQGMVTIESMALQKPVVNSNYGWAQELIDDEINGYLIDPENTGDYAKKIIDIIQDDALTKTIGKAAREKVERRFDIQIIVKDNIDFYKSLIKKHEV